MKNKFLLFKVILGLFLFNSNITNAQFTKLWDFGVVSQDGKDPRCTLVNDGTFLYGTTASGGINDMGIIFKIKPDGTSYAKLLDFDGTNTGAAPMQNALLIDGGYLYGMTKTAGLNGKGTIYKIQMNGSGFQKLFDFSGTATGANPQGALITDGNYLYGTTEQGGSNNLGVIFKIMLDGSNFSKILDFTGSINGQYPESSLVYDGTYLYGVSLGGGSINYGTIFKILTDGSGYVKLHDCTAAGTIGNSLYGGLILNGGYLYGMASSSLPNGYGTIYSIKTDGTRDTTLHSFAGPPDGGSSLGHLLFDGTFLFGMTYDGGVFNKGIIFKMNLDGTNYTKLFDFTGTVNGGSTRGSLISDGTSLYGTNLNGGSNNLGTVFKFQYNLATNITSKNDNDLSLGIFPNPSSDAVTIKSTKEGNYILINSLGETIKTVALNTNNNFTVIINELPQGIYYIIGKENKLSVSQKIVVIK